MRVSKEYLFFIIARIIGLSAKPLFLLYLMKYNTQENIQLLSIVYLLFGSVFVLYHVPVHFDYYKAYFEEKKQFLQIRNIFFNYLHNLNMHIIITLPIVTIITYFLVKDIYLTSLLVLYLLFEKVFDEIQRFLQFEKLFIQWSFIFLIKTLLPMVSTIFYSYSIGYKPIEFFILSTMGIIFLISIFILEKRIFYLLFKTYTFFKLQSIQDYILLLRRKYLSKYFLGISTANVLNSDKWLSIILNVKHFLAEITLIGQYANIIPIGMNYMTIANRRSELLKFSNTLDTLWYGKRVPVLAFGLFFVVLLILYFFEDLRVDIKELNFIGIIFILLSYTIYSLSAPISEYLFWNINTKKVLFIDIIFFFFSFCFGLYMYIFDEYFYIPEFIFIAHSIRLIFQLFLLNLLKRTL